MASKVSNHVIDRGVGQPHTAFIDSEQPNVLHLVLAKSLTANREHEFFVDQLRNQEGEILGTPIYRFYFDQSAPKLDSVQAVDERTARMASWVLSILSRAANINCRSLVFPSNRFSPCRL